METVFLAIMDQLSQRGDCVCTTEGLIGWWSLIDRGLLRWDLLIHLWGMMSAVWAFLRIFRDILLRQVQSYLWLLDASDLSWDFRINPLGLLIELFLLTLMY
jgi:hypothetical protein